MTVSSSTLPLILDALAFAAERHRDQRRKDATASPYINHPIALARLLVSEAGVDDPAVIAAALLHDTIEDTQTTASELRERFGARIAALVEEVTDDKALPKAERKRLQVEHAIELSCDAKLVKLADKTCNLRDVATHPPSDWSLARRAEYFDWAKSVVDRLRGVHPTLEALFDAAYVCKPAPAIPHEAGSRIAVGVDGCKAGWLAASRGADGQLAISVHPTARDVIVAAPDAVVAVDIPLGLSESGTREPDALARKRLAGTRASSVFTSPCAAVLRTRTYAEARAVLASLGGKSMSAQGYALVPSIRDWVELLTDDPTLNNRVFEVHPEVCFAEMQGGAGIADRKKSPEGAAARRRLLAMHFGEENLLRLEAQPRRGCASDDLYDALAALWTAERIRDGVARSMPEEPKRSSAGIPVAIWY